MPSGEIYGAESAPNFGMTEIRRHNPVVQYVVKIYAIPTFGGAVWRKHAAGNRKVISNMPISDTSMWPGGSFPSPDQ